MGDLAEGRIPHRQLAVLVAVDVVDPLAAANALGDLRWQNDVSEMVGRLIELARPALFWRSFGALIGVSSFPDLAPALSFARQAAALGKELKLPVGIGVNAGEILIQNDEASGVHVLVACEVAKLAHAGAIIVTQPAAAMAAGSIEGAADAGEWTPCGLRASWRLYAIGSPGLRDSGTTCERLAQRGLRYASALTDRERQVVLLVAAGRSNRELAGELQIAESTVERHLANVYRKLAFHSRTQLARWAIAQGVVD